MPRLRLALLLLFAAPVLRAQSPSRNGFSPERLARLDRFMQQFVDSNQIAGAVGFVTRDGKVVYERAVGWADKDAGRRMTPDVIFASRPNRRRLRRRAWRAKVFWS